MWAERRRQRDVGRITTASDHDAANARNIVARVEREPTSVKINFEPGIVVHRRRVRRHAYVPQESICIARRNIHAAAKRHRQMGEIATDALALCVGLEGGAGRARMCVTKGQAVADEIANRLNPSPARRLGSEKLPRDARELVGLAIAAAKQTNVSFGNCSTGPSLASSSIASGTQ